MAKKERFEKLVRFEELRPNDFDKMRAELFKREGVMPDVNAVINLACESLKDRLNVK